MIKLRYSHISKLKVVALVALFSVIGVLSSQGVKAESPTDYIGSNYIYYTVSAGSVVGASQGASNLLYAPDTYLIAYYGSQDGNVLQIPDGGFCSSQDSRARNAKLIIYGYSTVSEKKNGSSYYNYENIRDGTRRELGEISAETCGTTYSFNVPNDWLSQTNVPNHVSSSFGTPLFPMIVRVRIAYDNNKSDPINSGDAPLNTFKVNAPGAYIGAWTLDPNKWQDSSLEVDSAGQTVWLGRPSDLNTQEYTIPLAVPCTLFNDDLDHTVWIHWFDADQGTSYQQPTITMFLKTIKPDGTSTERQLTSSDSLTIGGEAEYGRVKVQFRRGYKYVWTWKNVTNKNGVRAWLPFNTTESQFACNQTPALQGSCDMNITNPSNGVVGPGQTVTGSIKVSNTGSSAWSVIYPSPAGQASFRLGVVGDNDRWGPGTKRLAIQPSVTGAFGPILEAGKSTNTPVSFIVPADMTGTETLTYRLLLEGDGVARSPYGTCETTFKVKVNRPFVSVQGSDLYSGASFEYGGVCKATDKAKLRANIDTNGYYKKELGQYYGSSNAQFGAFATGGIGDYGNSSYYNTFVGNFGYDRNSLDILPALSSYPGGARDALFSVIGSGDPNDYGHFYSNSPSPSLPCVDVSVARRYAVNTSLGSIVQFPSNTSSGVVSYTPPAGTQAGMSANAYTVPENTSKVIFINGDILIRNNINYAGSYASAASIPRLTIVANNIYIQSNVKNIDADLIAYPTNDATANGIIDTCSNLPGTTAGAWPASITLGGNPCQSQLRISGAVVARRLLLKRLYGTIGSGSDAAVADCAFTDKVVPGATAEGINKQCAAELFDFSPLNTIAGYSSGGGDLQTIPVGTQQLPPIY